MSSAGCRATVENKDGFEQRSRLNSRLGCSAGLWCDGIDLTDTSVSENTLRELLWFYIYMEAIHLNDLCLSN